MTTALPAIEADPPPSRPLPDPAEDPPPASGAGRRPRDPAMAALRDLGEAFLRADADAGGRILAGQEAELTPGLTLVVLRLLVLLFAERRARDHSASSAVLGQGRGAWARLLGLTRAVHAGSPSIAALQLPRGGRLFDPHAHPFLEGRPPGHRGPLPAPAELPAIPDALVARALGRLSLHLDPRDDDARGLARIGAVYESLLGLELRPAHPGLPGRLALQPGEARRAAGAHYTSAGMARIIVTRALAPLLSPDAAPGAILELRVCDPAMGAGSFLIEACEALAAALVRAWDRAGAAPPVEGGDPLACARRLVARHCLFGVDRNPLAVDLARISLGLLTAAPGAPPPFLDHALRAGDAILGLSAAQIAALSLKPRPAAAAARAAALVDAALTLAASPRRAIRTGAAAPEEALARAELAITGARALGDAVLATFLDMEDRRARPRALAALQEYAASWPEAEIPPGLIAGARAFRAERAPFHWELEYPEVFTDRGGFDAFVGNPPWVAYAGRAAQPLPAPWRDLHAALSPAFAGYRSLQGLFVHRAAALLRPGGRLGLVLPTSMADLDGYAPVRRAHDALCAPDDALPDFGDRAFDGVFQPSMGLLSTRRAASPQSPAAALWPLARSDLSPGAAALLHRLDALPRLPPRLFGERGFQTTPADAERMTLGPVDERSVGLRGGGDIAPFKRLPPGRHCDPSAFGARFRPERDWRAVRLLIRQTARFPMAALSDGLPFRNSILAGFGDDRYGEHFLLAYLNSTPVRWVHHQRHRDARQGMPQVKIGHLRALPAPPADHPAVAELSALGRSLGERNAGITRADQDALDRLAADALGMSEQERAIVAAWRAAMQQELRLVEGGGEGGE